MSDKTYNQEEVDRIINKVRIEERFLANQLMGDLGIPAVNRKYVNEKISIYVEAAEIVKNLILTPSQKNPDGIPQEP